MNWDLDTEPYDSTHGIRLRWDDDAQIAFKGGAVGTLRCNQAGLVTFARHLLTLAQDGVPVGSHLHLDSSNGLADGSSEIIVERVE